MTSTLQTLTYRFTLNAFKNGVQRILQGWQTGENLTRTLEISLMSGGEPYVFPEQGVTANMYVKRPSQTDPSINACTIDFENNKIIYEVLPTDITEAGIVSMQLKIFDGTKILISPLFGMEVWESQASSSQASSTPQYTALEQALAEAQAYSDKAIQQVYIDENNIFTIEFADGTEYTSSAFADAIAEVEQYLLVAEGYSQGTQNGEPVQEGNPYYHNNAKYRAEQAAESADNAATSELAAYASEQAAGLSETNADAYKKLAKSYAVGQTGERTGEDTDNAKYYKERCEQIAASIEGGFIPMGTVTFATLPDLGEVQAGWMYDVSDAFTSDSRFNDGGGEEYPAHSNVYATAQGKWDVLSGALPTINGKTGSSITLDGSDLLLTGYEKPSVYTPITTLDTPNSAIGKLEVRISGLLPHVIVSTETGVTVTLTKDLQTVTAVETGSGVYQADVPNFGTWTVTATGHGQTVTDTIAIDTVKIYEKTLTFFKASIAVTYPSGAICVCDGVTATTNPYTFSVWAADDYDVVTTLDGVAKTTSVTITTSGQTESLTVEFGTINVAYDNEFKGLDVTCTDGTTTITKEAPSDTSTMTFRVPNTATWVISSEYSSETYSVNATVSSLSTAVSVTLTTVTIPDGKTVTPTDDIQTWLACAGIFDKTYTTLNEVLADSTTLASLMADNNAVDYLRRSQTWISSITGNALAMHHIGINNYASDELLRSKNLNSYPYYNTTKTEYGITFTDNSDGTIKVGDNSTQTATSNSRFICHHFEYDNFVLPNGTYILSGCPSGGSTSSYVLTISHKNANNEVVTYGRDTGNGVEFTINGDDYYSGDDGAKLLIQIYVYDGATIPAGGITFKPMIRLATEIDDAWKPYVTEWKSAIQASSHIKNVYNIWVPAMTNDHFPKGECSSSGTNTASYYAFDGHERTGSENDYWAATGSTPWWLQYEFEEAVVITHFSIITMGNGSSGNGIPVDFSIQGSNDGTNFTTIQSYTNNNGYQHVVRYELNNSTAYKYYRMNITTVRSTSTSVNIPLIQELSFYGREDVPATITKKTFATATDAEIAEMKKWARRGVIDLEIDCGWAIGQTHTTTLGAIATTGTYKGVSWSVGESQAQQQITYVLSRKGVDELVDPQLKTDGTQKTVVNFRANQVDCLNTKGYMNSTNTNSGSWKGSTRRLWCIAGYFPSLPSSLQKACEFFKTITAKTYNGTENEIAYDFAALDAEKEIFGIRTKSNTTEANALTQATYYETSANRVKNVNASANGWWERSPSNANTDSFCVVSSSGDAADNSASTARGIAPFICF